MGRFDLAEGERISEDRAGQVVQFGNRVDDTLDVLVDAQEEVRALADPGDSRLKAVLLAWRERSAGSGRVVGIDAGRRGPVLSLDHANYRREWRKLVRVAQIEPRDLGGPRPREAKPKDLRDTFASHLLTAGIPIGFISQQLGHSDIGVTQKHYARWIGDASRYRRGPDLEGRVPADLLAALGPVWETIATSSATGTATGNAPEHHAG